MFERTKFFTGRLYRFNAPAYNSSLLQFHVQRAEVPFDQSIAEGQLYLIGRNHPGVEGRLVAQGTIGFDAPRYLREVIDGIERLSPPLSRSLIELNGSSVGVLVYSHSGWVNPLMVHFNMFMDPRRI